jgi:hypothetical protein
VEIPHNIVPERISFRCGPIDYLRFRSCCMGSFHIILRQSHGTFESFCPDVQQHCIDTFDVPIPRFG